MRQAIVGVAASSILVVLGCSAQQKVPADEGTQRQPVTTESFLTDLRPQACTKEADKTDPNETPYLVCPGPGGYALIVRRVDSGRKSIDLLDPQKRAFPLSFQEFVSRQMFTLGDNAEWRFNVADGKQVPTAVMTPIRLRENPKNPATVTRTIVAVAKISAKEACVTDIVSAGAEANARRIADSAPSRQCAPKQPPMTTTDGNVIR